MTTWWPVTAMLAGTATPPEPTMLPTTLILRGSTRAVAADLRTGGYPYGEARAAIDVAETLLLGRDTGTLDSFPGRGNGSPRNRSTVYDGPSAEPVCVDGERPAWRAPIGGINGEIMIKKSVSVRAFLASLLALALAPATVVATPAAAAGEIPAQADLEFAWRPESTDVSYLGGMGARAYVQAVATNVGTRAAAGVKFHFTPPPGSSMDPAENEQFGWTCDTSAATWACTNGRTIGAGEFEGLNLTVLLPAGTVGDTVTMSGSVSTTSRERSLRNNNGETTFRYVEPRPADIAVNSVSVVPAHQVKANEQFEVFVEMDNVGGSPARDVTVRVPLPPAVRAASLDPDHPGWSCALVGADAERAVECARDGAYDVSQPYNRLRLRLVAVPGTPDGPLIFTATAATTSSEEGTDNNTASGGTVYFAEGKMSGQAWLDNNRDGRRDADEPGAYGKVGKIEFVLEGTEPDWDVPRGHLDEQGRYSVRLKPGRYVANVYLMVESPYEFTVPDAGDDATDSDIIDSTGDDYYNRGWSAVVEVTDAGEAVVDVGLVPAV